MFVVIAAGNPARLYDNSVTPQTVRQQRYHAYTDNQSLTNIYDGVAAAENQSFWLPS